MGKFDWGAWYVIIFLFAQFWIRLAAVSCRGKKVWTVAFPAVRSVNKSRDTRNCVLNEPHYVICVIFTTRLYCKALGLILCYLIWQIRLNYNRLDDGHCDVTGHSKMSALGTASAMVTSHEISVMMWSFKDPKLICALQNILEMKKNDGLNIILLSISWIQFRIWVEFWLVSSFWKLLVPFDWGLCG